MNLYYAILHHGHPGAGADNIVGATHQHFGLRARLVPGGSLVDADRQLNFTLARGVRGRQPLYVTIWDGPTRVATHPVDMEVRPPSRAGEVVQVNLKWTNVTPD